MRLVKHRPEVTLHAPRFLVPGQSAVLEARVRADRSVPVDYVRIDLSGTERATHGSGKSQTTDRTSVLALAANVMGEGELPRGTHRFPCRFDLPPDLPPSYSGRRVGTEYTATVRVSIPWWPDRVEHFVITVVPSAVAGREAESKVWSSDVHGPRGTGPHLEVGLAGDVVVPGDVLSGTVALSNVAHNRYEKVRLALCLLETKYDSAGRDRGTVRAREWVASVPAERAGEGERIPFNLAVPKVSWPTWRSRLWSLAWSLEVRAEIAWARDLTIEVPIEVLASGSSVHASEEPTTPVVGAERIQRLWSRVAAEVGLSFDGSTMQGRVGDVSIGVRREHRGPDGLHLVGEIRYPSVHLGIDGGLVSGFRRLIGGGVSFGDARWDGEHYIAGRDPVQVRSFGVVLFALLRQHRVSDFDDEHIEIERADTGTGYESLRAFAASLRQLALTVPRARDAIPPPEAMEPHVESWQALARELSGQLELSRMAVAGRYRGFGCEVFTDWSTEGEARRTAVVLRSPFPIDAEDRFGWTPRTELDGYASRLPRGAPELLEALGEEALSWAVGEEAVTVSLPAPLPEPAPVVLPRLEVMARLIGLLRREAGPYR